MQPESTPTWLIGPEIPPTQRIGTVLSGSYRLDAFLGQGMTGVTYNAWHLRIKAPYAVKLLHRELHPTHEQVIRLRQDLRLLQGIAQSGRSADPAHPGAVHGPGFLPDVIDRIGEPYMSTRQGTEPGGGLGLGLFIAKTLLERSGAMIRFRNSAERGEGAMVEITWSRDAFAAPEALAEASAS